PTRRSSDLQCAQPVAPTQVEGRRDRALTQDERDPRRAAPQNVGRDQLAERPRLQVLPLDVGVENDARAVVEQPRPQLDVLDRGTSVMLVKAVDVHEWAALDGADTRPERRGTSRAAAVHVVVEEV